MKDWTLILKVVQRNKIPKNRCLIYPIYLNLSPLKFEVHIEMVERKLRNKCMTYQVTLRIVSMQM